MESVCVDVLESVCVDVLVVGASTCVRGGEDVRDVGDDGRVYDEADIGVMQVARDM